MLRISDLTEHLMQIVDRFLGGDPREPRRCEDRRPAHITYIRHGERSRHTRRA